MCVSLWKKLDDDATILTLKRQSCKTTNCWEICRTCFARFISFAKSIITFKLIILFKSIIFAKFIISFKFINFARLELKIVSQKSIDDEVIASRLV